MKTKTVPCLVLDSTGKTEITLKAGQFARFGNPDWHCNKVDCSIRSNCLGGEVGAVYRDLRVTLGTRSSIHGVVKCEGGGRTERR